MGSSFAFVAGLALLLLLCGDASAFWGSSGGSAVKELSAADFDDLVSQSKVAYVEFYAPWCGHCKRLAPTWEKVAEKVLQEHGDDAVVVGKVDCTKYRDTCTSQQIRGYPTIKLYEKDAQEGKRFQGSRTVEDFYNFLSANAL